MKSVVVYYSESGNTRKVAQAIATGLGSEAKSITEIEPEELSAFGLICIGTPVHNSAPDKKIVSFISQMPDMSGKKAAVFFTHHLSGDKKAGRVLKKELEVRGMEYLGSFTARGRSRLIANFGPRIFMRDRPNRAELAAAEEFGRKLAIKNVSAADIS
jgi:flavodoxin